MQAFAENPTGRWAFSSGVAVLAVLAVLLLFRFPEISEPRPARVPKPSVVLQALDGSDAAFDEKTQLTDPTPLFLPTKWNAAQKVVIGPEPGRIFENYAPKFSPASAGNELKLNLPPPVAVPATPVEALAAGSPEAPLFGFGQTDAKLPELPARGAFVEIIAEGTGQRVFSKALLDAKPPGEGSWEPMEFLAAVDAAGLVGPLVPTRRSGVAEVDNYFLRYLVQSLRVGQRLTPGNYRITVGP